MFELNELSFLVQPVKLLAAAIIGTILAGVMTGCSANYVVDWGNEAIQMRNEKQVDSQQRVGKSMAELRLFQPITFTNTDEELAEDGS